MGVPMVIWKDGKVVEFMPEPEQTAAPATAKIRKKPGKPPASLKR